MNLTTKVEIIGLSALLLAIGGSIAYGYEEIDQDKLKVVQEAVADYSKDYGVGDCYLNGEKLSLTAIVLGITSSESGYGTYGLGAKHNNRGNLKLAVQYPLPKQGDKESYVHGDGGRYYKYTSAYDGIYDIAHWVNTKGKTKCNVTTRTFTIFIKGTTNISATQKKAVERHVANLTQVAKAYDSNSKIYVVNNEDTKLQADIINGIDEPQELNKQGPTERKMPKGTPLVKVKKICREQVIDIKKGEYLEVSYLGKIRMRIRNLWKNDEIKICRDVN